MKQILKKIHIFKNIYINHMLLNKQHFNAYLLHIDLNVFLQVVSVQVQNQIVDKVKSVTHND